MQKRKTILDIEGTFVDADPLLQATSFHASHKMDSAKIPQSGRESWQQEAFSERPRQRTSCGMCHPFSTVLLFSPL